MRKAISKKTRLEVFNKFGGRCAYCGCFMEYKDMQVDHIKPIHRGFYEPRTEEDNSIENLNPSCRACNFYKSTYNLEAFRHNIEHRLIGKLHRDFNYKMLLKYGMIHEDFKPVRFYYESYESEV